MNSACRTYYLTSMYSILSIAVPVGAGAFFGLLALLINYHILANSHAQYLYWLTLYAPFNYYLIALYEGLKASSIFYSSQMQAHQSIRMMLSLLVVMCGIILVSSIIFYCIFFRYKFFHQEKYFSLFCLSMIVSALFVSWFYIATSFYYGLQRKNLSMLLNFVAGVLSCLLTGLFVKKCQWGIFSYAVSNIFSYGLIGCLSFWYFFKQHVVQSGDFFIGVAELWHALKLLYAVGFPVWASYFIIFVSLSFTNTILNTFGHTVLSAYGLAYRIQSMVLFPAIALGSALAISVNQYRVKQKFIFAFTLLKVGLLSSLFLYLGAALLCFLYPYFLMHSVTNNLNIVAAGVEYFKSCALSYAALGPMIAYGVFLEQIGLGLINFCVQSGYFLILTGFGWYTTQILHNYHYFYYAIAADNFFCFFVMGILFFILNKDLLHQSKKQIVMVH